MDESMIVEAAGHRRRGGGYRFDHFHAGRALGSKLFPFAPSPQRGLAVVIAAVISLVAIGWLLAADLTTLGTRAPADRRRTVAPLSGDGVTEPQLERRELSSSLAISEAFDGYRDSLGERSFHSEIEFFETMLSYGPLVDPRPALLLANAYIITQQQRAGIAFFETLLARHDGQFPEGTLPTYLAAYALLRATYADQVSLLQRVGWMRATFRILDEAETQSHGSNPLVKWASGLVYAQTPSLFGKRQSAVEALTWLVDHPETEPTPGFYREAYRYLGELHGEAGNPTLAAHYRRQSGYGDEPPSVPFMGWLASTKQDGLLFSPTPWIEEIVPGRVLAVRGFGFSDLHFVTSEDGAHLISIDAATQPFSMREGLAFLRAEVPGLPPLTTVFVTHAHWDHIGGHTYLRTLEPQPRFYGRGNFHSTVDRTLRSHRYKQFRSERFEDSWVDSYRPDVSIDTDRTVTIGGTQFRLIPATGGETEDALLVHVPSLGTLFMGDALMPFYGEPWVEEGFIDEAVQTMDRALSLDAAHILHGHYGITIIYGADQLAGFREAYVWLVAETRRHIAHGYSAEDVIRLNLIPPMLHRRPELFLGYFAARDALITRVGDHMTGIWREEATGQEPYGLDVVTSIEYGRMLDEYLRLSEGEIGDGIRRMLAGGDNALALKMSVAAARRFPDNESFIALRNEAADRLRSAAQFFDPFKFVVYTELRDAEHPSIPLRPNR